VKERMLVEAAVQAQASAASDAVAEKMLEVAKNIKRGKKKGSNEDALEVLSDDSGSDCSTVSARREGKCRKLSKDKPLVTDKQAKIATDRKVSEDSNDSNCKKVENSVENPTHSLSAAPSFIKEFQDTTGSWTTGRNYTTD